MFLAKVGSTVTKGMAVAAVLLGSTAATANTACQPGTGCVLPITDQQTPPPPAPIGEVPPPAPVEAAPVVAAGGGGLGLFAILAGLAALGLLAFLVFDDDGDGASPG
ncbi:MAG TPA: hypothetical protein VF631_14195 [Allosphingosinicella sp.]|jgi:hypothetical protein|uniref:hypothetical protein n=1 Tax=Allosphingosinicella sp. TaxID=2823234 RepID=UPI002F28B4CE